MIKKIRGRLLNSSEVPAEPVAASASRSTESAAKIQSSFRQRKQHEQKNVFLLAEAHEEDEGGEGSGEVGIGSLLPESDYYEVHELIRSKHKGKVEAARKFHDRLANNNTQTADFNEDMHPLAAMAYFSGIDNRDETPLPGESTDEEAQQKLELVKRLQLQKQLGISNTYSPTPKPF